MVVTWRCISIVTSTILSVYFAVGDTVDTTGELAANQALHLCQRDSGVERGPVSACVRLLQLRQVLVVLAVDVDFVAIILSTGNSSGLEFLIDRDIGVSLLVPLVLHLLLVDVVDVLRHVRFVFSRSFDQVSNCSFTQESGNSSSHSS